DPVLIAPFGDDPPPNQIAGRPCGRLDGHKFPWAENKRTGMRGEGRVVFTRLNGAYPGTPIKITIPSKTQSVFKLKDLIINEIYLSLQGESTFAGLPCIFIRLTACDLRCSYCDTAYAFTEGKHRSL